MRVLEVTMVLEKWGNVHVSNVSFELSMQYATGQRRRFERDHIKFSILVSRRRSPVVFQGCKDGAVVRPLASHQCGPGSILA